MTEMQKSQQTLEQKNNEIHVLRQELLTAQAEIDQLRLGHQNTHLCVYSTLTDVRCITPIAELERDHLSPFWNSWCPCCKRPLKIAYELPHPSPPENTEQHMPLTLEKKDSYAYVTVLWGKSLGFVLGALVLGQALKKSGTPHDLVLLHTKEVPSHALHLLSKIWYLRLVEEVKANEGLFRGGSQGSRFCGVFTKLHGLSLVEYKKIVMLDIDVAILQCPDALFQLQAPAALWRGQAQTEEHGFKIDGKCFFGGAHEDWMQTGGINAGVMVLAPDSVLHARALREVTAPIHPERIPGAGPEQDYLSRFFAPDWTHVSVLYNFQLHHLFFGLDAAIRAATAIHYESKVSEDMRDISSSSNHTFQSSECFSNANNFTDPIHTPWMPGRLMINLEHVKIVHFSGELKMWDRDYLGKENDEQFVIRMLRINSEQGARLWLNRRGSEEEYAHYGLKLNGNIFQYLDDDTPATAVTNIVETAILQIRNAALQAAQKWHEDLEDLPSVLECESVRELLQQIGRHNADETPDDAGTAATTSLRHGDDVEVYWRSDEQWYSGTIMAVWENGTMRVEFDESLGVGDFSENNIRRITPGSEVPKTSERNNHRWSCDACKQDKFLSNCWHCKRWECRDCAFWCTLCPRDERKHYVCSECQQQGGFLKNEGQKWLCDICSQSDGKY